MDEYKVIWSDRSLKDLEGAYDLLAENSAQAASRTVEAILERVTQLEKFPESGPIELSLAHHKKAHRYLVSGHHKIIYRVEQQAVFIVRVFDTRQHPKKLR